MESIRSVSRPYYRKIRKVCKSQAVPGHGEGVNRQVDGRGKYEQIRQKVSYRTVLNTCLSFLNEDKHCYDCNVIKGHRRRVKNLAKDTGIKYSDLGTHPCPYRLA